MQHENKGATGKILQNAVDEFYVLCKKHYGECVHDIILYGSYARGDNKEDSDIDIMVILKDGTKIITPDMELCSIASNIDYKYDVFIAPLVRTISDYESKKHIAGFYHNIYMEGISLNGRK